LVTDKESLNFLREIIEIYSPSYEEEEISNYLYKKLIDFGFSDLKKDSVGNVIARFSRGKGKRILLCGHMDTVPGKLEVKEDEEKIYGRGAVDAKSSLAAMIVSAANVKDSIKSGEIVLAAVVREEADGAGINEVIKNNIVADYAIFGEPSNTNGVTIGYKGKVDATVKVTSRNTGHSSDPWIYDNAIDYAFIFLNEIRNKYEDKRSLFDSVTICPTKITGGETNNVVPKFCEVKLDIRIPPSVSSREFSSMLLKDVKNFNERYKNVFVEVFFSGDLVDAYTIDVNNYLVRSFVRSIVEVVGRPVRLIKKSGTCDINPYYTFFKIPSLSYGPGDPKLSHTENEYVVKKDFLNSVKVIEKALLYLTEER